MKTLLKILAISFLTIAVLEVSCRIYLFGKIPKEQLPKTISEKAALFLSGGAYVVEFQDQYFLIRKPKNVFRIMVLGGSTTQCFYIDHKKSWTYKLQSKLNNAHLIGKKIEVINLGLMSATSGEEYFNLVTHFDIIKPDSVIVYDGYNDLIDSNLAQSLYMLKQARVYNLINSSLSDIKMKDFLNMNSALFNRLYVNLDNFKASLNKYILRQKMLGAGEYKRLRGVENFKWFQNNAFIFNEMEYNTVNYVTDRYNDPKIKDQLSQNEITIINDILAGKKTFYTNIFVEKILSMDISIKTKTHILQLFELDRIKFKIGNLIVDYNSVENADYKNLHTDLLPMIYIDNLSSIADFLKTKKVPVLLVFQPFLSEKQIRFNKELKQGDYITKSFFDVDGLKRISTAYPLRLKLAQELLKEKNVEFANFQKIFDNYDDDKVYLDICHNSEVGLEILAEDMFNLLVERNLITPKS